MHSPEIKDTFFTLRANGHSLRSIAAKLGVSKSILFHWESDPGNRRIINGLKSVQIEGIQEKLIPSFEEELQKLSTLLVRVESALAVHDFEDMRPEFLLRTAVQLRTRLQKLRCEVHPVDGFYSPDPAPALRPGCISRSESLDNLDDASSAGSLVGPVPSPDVTPSPLDAVSGDNHDVGVQPSGCPPSPRNGVRGDNLPGPSISNQTELDKNENLSTVQPSTPATSADQNWAVQFSRPSPTPLPDETDQIALTARFDSPQPPICETSHHSQPLQHCSQ